MTARAGRRIAALGVLVATVAVAVALVGTSRSTADVQVHLTAAGDYGAKPSTATVLQKVADLKPDAHLAVGDLAYGDITPESAWCAYVKARVGEGFPFELVSGNHESSDGNDGKINNYSACLPNQIPGITGTYGREYFMDFPRVDPLVRVIQTSAGLTFEDGKWAYQVGDPHYTWVANAIDEGRAKGAKWIVVTAHYPCLSTTTNNCQTEAFTNLMLAKKVDLVLNGHSHAYERTHQLRTSAACSSLTINAFNAGCLADTDGAFVAGGGTVFATVGTGGQTLNPISASDPESGYFAVTQGQDANATYGLLDLTATGTQLSANFVTTSGATLSDSFTLTQGVTPPGPVMLADDDFARSVASGWGTAPTGGPWTVSTASAFSVNGTAGRVTTSAIGRNAFLRSVSSTGTDTLVAFSTDKTAAGGAYFLSVIGRSIVAVGDYRAFYRLKSDGRIAVTLRRTLPDGSAVALGAEVLVPGVTVAAGESVSTRLEVTGVNPTVVRVKVWKTAGVEPSTWLTSASDATSGLQAAGSPGVNAYLPDTVTNGPIVLSVDQFTVVQP